MIKKQQDPKLNQPKTIRLGVWGPPNSGKTVYMTMLCHYLRVADSSPWKVEITDKSTIKFVTENLSLIRTKGEFMRATEIRRDEPPKVYSYKLKRKDGLTKDVELNFFDLPGEFYLGGDRYSIADQNGRALSVAQYLNQCHGIMFLLSPLVEDKSSLKGFSYYDLLENLFMNMQSERQSSSPELEQYVAFCITKVDHPEVYDRFCNSTATKSLLKALGNNVSLNWFQNFFHTEINRRKQELNSDPTKYNRCQFFYISPFGVYRDEEKNLLKSPVSEKGDENKPVTAKSSQSSDINLQIPNQKSDQYENMPAGIPSHDDWGSATSKAYKINTEVSFSPINVLSPIQWLIKGIEQNPPNIDPLEVISEEENNEEET